MTAWLGLILVVIAVLVLVTRSDGSAVIGMEQADFASIVAGLALLILIGGGAFMAYRGKGSKAIKDLTIWLAILLGLMTIYSFRLEFQTVANRVASELLPGRANSSYFNGNGEAIVEIKKHNNGHFITRVRINGATVEMMVDTGASTISLTQSDAQRIGFDTSKLIYSIPVNTANGRAMAAMAQLNTVSIGDISARNIRAHISKPGTLSRSLLGMSFLSRLRSYEVRDGMLILRR